MASGKVLFWAIISYFKSHNPIHPVEFVVLFFSQLLFPNWVFLSSPIFCGLHFKTVDRKFLHFRVMLLHYLLY